MGVADQRRRHQRGLTRSSQVAGRFCTRSPVVRGPSFDGRLRNAVKERPRWLLLAFPQLHGPSWPHDPTGRRRPPYGCGKLQGPGQRRPSHRSRSRSVISACRDQMFDHFGLPSCCRRVEGCSSADSKIDRCSMSNKSFDRANVSHRYVMEEQFSDMRPADDPVDKQPLPKPKGKPVNPQQPDRQNHGDHGNPRKRAASQQTPQCVGDGDSKPNRKERRKHRQKSA